MGFIYAYGQKVANIMSTSTATATRTAERTVIVGSTVKITNRQTYTRYVANIRSSADRAAAYSLDKLAFDETHRGSGFIRFEDYCNPTHKIAVIWRKMDSLGGLYRRQLIVNGKLAKVRFYQSK